MTTEEKLRAYCDELHQARMKEMHGRFRAYQYCVAFCVAAFYAGYFIGHYGK